MLNNMKGSSMKAVIDRFEESYAVVLVGDNEIQFCIPRSLLPAGAKEGSWLNISFDIDKEGEQKQRDKIQNLLDKVKNRHR